MLNIKNNVYKFMKKGKIMLEQKIYDFVTKYKLIETGDRIVLGVSGGPDSICMLDILHKISGKIGFEIFVAHVNHGLRENAVIDEEFVKEFCEKIQVPVFVKHANVAELAKKQKRGLEETGRFVRYEFFDEVMKQTGSNKVAIAHNSNDNAETIIMNILRGTGAKGLAGIEKKSGKYIRPLIETRRLEIEEYLKEKGIQARHDESNDDNTYTRNKIRNVVLPYIEKEFNPNIITSLERMSDIIKEQEEFLQNQTAEVYEKLIIDEKNIEADFENNNAEIILDLRKFNSEEKIIQKRVILYSVNKIFGTTKGLEKIHIDDIIKLCNNNIGNKYLTPNKNLKIVIQKKQLRIMSVK